MKNFAQRVREIKISLIRQLPVWATKVPHTVSLGQGVPSFPLPEYIREKLIDALRSEKNINKYSLQPGMPALKEAVTVYLKDSLGVQVDQEKELCITTGSISGLFCAISSLIERGDEVILLTPAYEPHIEQVKFAEGIPVFVPLVEEGGWRPDLEGIKRAITKKTKAIILCDPSNPTGSIFEKEDLEKIVRLAIDADLFIITDETYDFLIYENKKHFSVLSLPGARDRLIACFSFSKKYAMTGFRVGYVFASESIMSQILKVHDESSICAPTISQYAALFALTGPQDSVKMFQLEFAKRRELMCKRLDTLLELFEYQKPMGAYYILPKLKIPMKSLDFSLKLLNTVGVITVPGVAFGPAGEGHIRLSFAGEEKDIHEAFDRIGRYWRKLM